MFEGFHSSPAEGYLTLCPVFKTSVRLIFFTYGRIKSQIENRSLVLLIVRNSTPDFHSELWSMLLFLSLSLFITQWPKKKDSFTNITRLNTFCIIPLTSVEDGIKSWLNVCEMGPRQKRLSLDKTLNAHPLMYIPKIL